jgi:hypothetical protein
MHNKRIVAEVAISSPGLVFYGLKQPQPHRDPLALLYQASSYLLIFHYPIS